MVGYGSSICPFTKFFKIRSLWPKIIWINTWIELEASRNFCNPLKIGMGIVGTLPNNSVMYRSPWPDYQLFGSTLKTSTFDLILQNLAAKLVCLSIVVAYRSSKCPFTNFSKLGHCDLIVIWIRFLFAGDLWAVLIIYLITLHLCCPCSVSRSFINIWQIRCTPVTWQKTTECYSPSSAIAAGGRHCFCAVAKTSTALVLIIICVLICMWAWACWYFSLQYTTAELFYFLLLIDFM